MTDKDRLIRMAVEAEELQEKINKLSVFLKTDAFRALPPISQDRLTAQWFAMCTYMSILNMRIKCD